MKAVYTACLIAMGLISHAQTRTIYFTSKWEITSKEKASYYRIGQVDYGSIKYYYTGRVEDYSMDGNLIMKGTYDELGLKTGEFVLYYPNAQVQAQGNFKNNLRERTWKYFFDNGKPEREVKFPVLERFTVVKDHFEPISVYDSTGTQLIKNGTGQWHYEYEWAGVDGRYVVDGRFEKGKKEGDWTCKLNDVILYKELYKSDKFIEGFIENGSEKQTLTEPIDNKFILPYKFEVTENFVYEKGTTLDLYPFLSFLPVSQNSFEAESKNIQDTIPKDQTVYVTVEQPAEFPGGMIELMKFIEKNLVYPKDALRMGVEGKVYVQFVVNKDGSISDIKVFKGVSVSLDKEAIRVISIFPKWIPGMQNGMPVKSRFVLPVPFKLK